MGEARHATSLLILAAGLVTAGCDKTKPEGSALEAAATEAAAAPQALGAEPLGKGINAAVKVQILHVDVTDDFGIIVPCTKVRTNVYERGLKKEKVALKFTITYMSNRTSVTKTATIPFKDTTIAPDHAEHSDQDKKDKADKKFVFIDSRIDVRDQKVDAGSTPRGTVELVKVKGDTRASLSDSELEEVLSEVE